MTRFDATEGRRARRAAHLPVTLALLAGLATSTQPATAEAGFDGTRGKVYGRPGCGTAAAQASGELSASVNLPDRLPPEEEWATWERCVAVASVARASGPLSTEQAYSIEATFETPTEGEGAPQARSTGISDSHHAGSTVEVSLVGTLVRCDADPPEGARACVEEETATRAVIACGNVQHDAPARLGIFAACRNTGSQTLSVTLYPDLGDRFEHVHAAGRAILEVRATRDVPGFEASGRATTRVTDIVVRQQD